MKEYVKPDLYYENFELSEHVASCAWKLNAADKENCTADYNVDGQVIPGLNDQPIFTKASASCTNAEKYCYTNSTEAYGLWRS